MVAERFPELHVPAQMTPIPVAPVAVAEEGSPGNVANTVSQALTGAETPPARSSDRVVPLSAGRPRWVGRRTLSGSHHVSNDERFRYAQELLGRQ